jgi:translation elongation factor EF-1alpha
MTIKQVNKLVTAQGDHMTQNTEYFSWFNYQSDKGQTFRGPALCSALQAFKPSSSQVILSTINN